MEQAWGSGVAASAFTGSGAWVVGGTRLVTGFCRVAGGKSFGSVLSLTRARLEWTPRVADERSVLHPTRLETRTMESNMCASHGALCETPRRSESKDEPGSLRCDLVACRRRNTGPSGSSSASGGARAYTLVPERW